MTDSTLQRVWDSRETISRRCDYDARKLVEYYQARRQKAVEQSHTAGTPPTDESFGREEQSKT